MEANMSDSDNLYALQTRVRRPLYERLENWRRSQPDIPARSDAMRKLLERALAVEEAAAA